MLRKHFLFKLVLPISFGILLVGCEFQNALPGSSACMAASFLSTSISGLDVGIGYTNLGGTSIAQSFIPNSSQNVVSVSVALKRVGTFPINTQTIWAEIQGNSASGLVAGDPDGTSLGTSESLDVATIAQGNGSYYKFKFSNSVSLSDSRIYWIRLKTSYPVNDSNYISALAHDGRTDGYKVQGVYLNAVYETNHSTSSFSTALIGSYRFLLFSVGC